MPLDLGKPTGQYGCNYQKVLAGLSDADAAQIRAAVADPQWSPSELSAKLADNNIDLPHQTIGVHRRQGCKACL